jgi:hypothetical protein
MFCPKCNKENIEDVAQNQPEINKSPQKPIASDDRSKKYRNYVVVGIILIILFMVVLGSLNVLKTQQPYVAQDCNNVQIPYTDRECNNVQTPYSTQDCTSKDYAYNVQLSTCNQYVRGIFTPDPSKVVCTLNNLERQPGVFVITYGFQIAGQDVVFSVPTNTYAMGSQSMTYTYNGMIDACICQATPPQLQDCSQVIKYRTDTQCHDVTKYRTENQCHDVTKYRTISIWRSLFG